MDLQWKNTTHLFFRKGIQFEFQVFSRAFEFKINSVSSQRRLSGPNEPDRMSQLFNSYRAKKYLC